MLCMKQSFSEVRGVFGVFSQEVRSTCFKPLQSCSFQYIYSEYKHSTASFFNEKKGACILYEIWGAELCAVQKATGLSLGTQNKRQNWAIVSICCPRERERERERVASEDTMGR